jgi:transposase
VARFGFPVSGPRPIVIAACYSPSFRLVIEPSLFPQAYRQDDGRLVRRLQVLLDLLVHHVSMEVLQERWGVRPSCISEGRKAFLFRGIDSLVYRPGGGRPKQLPPTQRQRLVERIDAGPLVVGFETACRHSVLIRVLIWRECGVLYNRHDVCTLLRNLGFSCHKARVVSDHLDTARRPAWLRDEWPQILLF